jgi:hypothetical protein
MESVLIFGEEATFHLSGKVNRKIVLSSHMSV